VRRLVRLGLITLAVRVMAKRLPHAQRAYRKAVSSGARPIEAAGTAVAAFIGLAPGGSVDSP
jgi:hypothetical protein